MRALPRFNQSNIRYEILFRLDVTPLCDKTFAQPGLRARKRMRIRKFLRFVQGQRLSKVSFSGHEITALELNIAQTCEVRRQFKRLGAQPCFIDPPLS